MATLLSRVVTKSIGAGGLGLGIYDAHSKAKRESIRQGKRYMADNTMDAWMNSTRLESDSEVEAGMRKVARNWRLDSPVPKIWGNLKGYASGFFHSVAENVVPIVLSAGVFASKTGSAISKLSMVGLGGYAIYKGVRAFLPTARSRQNPE